MTLDMTAIPRKTARGQQEIAEKSQNISPHLRRALLIVDGEKNFNKLVHLAQGFGGETNFVELLEDGMIEIVDTSSGHIEATTGSNIDLRKYVIEALKDVYGGGIVKEVNKIAKKFPPETDGADFLNACSKKAMMLMNKKEVDEIFNPILKKIKN